MRPIKRTILFHLFSIVCLLPLVQAKDVYFTSKLEEVDWSDETIWDNGVPTAGDNVFVVTAGLNLTIHYNISEGPQLASFVFGPETCNDCKCEYFLYIHSNSILDVQTLSVSNRGKIVMFTDSKIRGSEVFIDGYLGGNINIAADVNISGVMDPFDMDANGNGYYEAIVDGSLIVWNGSILMDLQGDVTNTSTFFSDSISIRDSVEVLLESTLTLYFNNGSAPVDNATYVFFQYGVNASGGFPSVLSIIVGVEPFLREGAVTSRHPCPSTTLQPPIKPVTNCQNADTTRGFSILIATSDDQCCMSGWSGISCSVFTCPENCDRHGYCDGSAGNTVPPTCVCDTNWNGDNCELPVCPNKCSDHGFCDRSTVPKCVCYDGWDGEDCSIAACINNCSGNGKCVAGSDQTAQCDCDVGYEGRDCSGVVSRGKCAENCNDHGVCDANTQVCTCEDNWGGNACIFALCPVSSNCSTHGKCVEQNGTNVCQCNDGWTGEICSEPVCLNGCSGAGRCTYEGLRTPVCECFPDNYGEDCSQVSDKDDKNNEDVPKGAIIGAVLGSVAVVAAGMVAVVFYLRREKREVNKALKVTN